ncbi:SRPBCC family protein [Nocardioides jiangxiensis]|uniref:SRPBCC family protein n=1 Tax=Nocardioides jiangxiensis TaxID=3064524 RepID=A0ABT9AZ56_9ACTN|nr:SRPBCC family protein [Nocardioides sp. WY-20]MDO7867653.1 SRPBCC family protein [Nocardioides sp. WY-20]
MTGQTATADVDISASPAQVWHALTDPELIARYFFGARVDTSWEPGSTITWSGEYDGRSYQDHGTVLTCKPEQLLEMTHFSPLSGLTDEPQNHHRLRFELTEEGTTTHVHLEQDNNRSADEAQASQENWRTVLGNLKELVERG